MGTFADKVIDGFNAILAFLASIFGGLFDLISGAFKSLMEFLAVPLGWLMWFLEGIFYFFEQFFSVAFSVVKIFTALFQYLGSLFSGVFRMIQGFLTVNVTESTNFVSSTESGFSVVMDLIRPMGLLTIVPMVATGFVWFYFAMKVFSAFGGTISIASPFARKEGDKL